MPGWYQDVNGVWHLTAERDDDIVVPCLSNLYIYVNSEYYAKRLPSKGTVCIECVRCWDAVSQFICEDM